MKKHTEKLPIDELFAQKLGNMSLPPSPDGFERLQARMGQTKPEARIVFWRNPDLQRYMAVAACLLLVCLFGWLYWPSGKSVISNGQQVASRQSAKSPIENSDQRRVEQSVANHKSESVVPDRIAEQTNEQRQQVTVATKSIEDEREKSNMVNKSLAVQSVEKTTADERNEATVAQTVPVKKTDVSGASLTEASPINKQPEQVADNKPVTKPTQVSERVLEVTIAEPEALVTARQVAMESVQEKPAVATLEKQPKETKGFWQQVKRIKEGEVFARHDNPTNDERGLLGRAYNGLKQSFDKDKSAKQ